MSRGDAGHGGAGHGDAGHGDAGHGDAGQDRGGRGDAGQGDVGRGDTEQGGARRLGRLDEAIAVLAASGLELSGEELLDALWLAGRLPEDGAERAPLARAVTRGGAALPGTRPGPIPRPAATASPPASAQRTEQRTTPADTARANGGVPGARPSAPAEGWPDDPPEQRPARAPRGGDQRLRGLYGGSQAPGAEGAEGLEGTSADARRALPLRVPEDKALHQELSIGRALRPLKQHRPNPLKREFDEAATATALAETGLPDVVTRPARERWLDLALVIDDGMSMLLWRRLAVELRTVLQRSGAFRVVRVLGLHTRGDGAPALRTRPYAPEAPLLPTTALSDPSGHTLVLVVSDGVGAAWRDGRMGQVLARWAGFGPTAVVHALPPRLWEGSGIRTRRWQVRTRRPGSANADWTVADPVLPAALARFAGVPVPVLEPDAGPLADWARLIASASGTAVLPLLVPPRDGPRASPHDGPHASPHDGPRTAPAAASAPAAAVPAPADELGPVQRFRDAASPEAYRLAAHLAAVAPLPVPVMRMVQKAVDGRTDTGRLAEVFLGGLMRPVEPPASAGTDPLPPEHRPFTFTDAAQRALLGAVPLAELVATSRLIGRRLEQLAGRSPDFPAWLADPGGTDRLPPGARPFSTVERRLAARLGATSLSSAFTTRTAAEQWRRLEPRDPRTIGPYRLTMAGPPGARLNPYLGRDPYGAEAIVQVARRVRGQQDADLLAVEAEALRRMDGRYARRLLREGLNDDVPWVAEEALIGERLDFVLRADAERWGDRLDDALLTSPERWDGHTALALARKVADAVRISEKAGMVHGDLSVSTVHIAGENILLTGWSSATIDRMPSPASTDGRPPAFKDVIGALGDILLCLGGGAQTRRPAPGLYFMPRWSDAAWEPLRAMVMACRENPSHHTARGIWEFLMDFQPDAAPPHARAGQPRPRPGEPTTCAVCGDPLDPFDRFCGVCGADLSTTPPLPASSGSAGAPRTEPESGLPSFDPYRAYRRLGGSRGQDVYLARRSGAANDVVIRVAPGAHRELRTEAEALRRMSGHYAPRLVADDSYLNPPWITQEFISLPDGSPAPLLSTLLGRRSDGSPRLDAVHAATIGLRVAEAVNMCALKGIVLGTLTADTVLVVGRTVKLIGWTDASINDRHRKTPTHADNVYALGEILRALSDAQPTAQLSRTDAIWREPQLISIVSACLDDRPSRRPSAGRVAEVLVRCLPPVLASAHTSYEVETSAPPSPPDGTPDAGPAPTTAPEPPRPPRSTRSRLAALVGLGGRSARAEQRQRKLDLIRTPLPSCHRIAVISRPVSAGRTVTTLALGALLAAERQDQVIAVDAMPGGDSLSRRVDGRSEGAVHDLARAGLPIDDAESIRRFTSRLPSGLEVLLGDTTPMSLVGRAAPIDDTEYRRVMTLLAPHYPIVLSDSDTGALHRSMRGIVDLADQLIIVTTPSVEHMRSAHTALDRLAEDGHADLVRRAITVINMSHDVPWTDHYEGLAAGFRDRCRGVAVVPYDEHLATRGAIDLQRLASRTLDAYIDLAALVAEGFPGAGT
ncbi:SAV_2336 N-terminal domain-related protein [Streptomyces rhizosphaericus]|uniref:Protein kinase domain-containing protein n=1 Tax=Streptomyces rhizosphaericus TaxID=114699 RepID=A0ABP4BE02_9ACTN|nr:SAV_2336 N-terminal domain-related protein [Streptomyces cangkringensis]